MGAPTEKNPKIKVGKNQAGESAKESRGKRTPLWFKLTAAVGVVLLTGVAALLLMPAKPHVYDINLTTEPPGATVLVNGVEQADLTPAVIPLKLGDTIEFLLDRHHPVELTLAKGMEGLFKNEEDRWYISSQLERVFSLDSSRATQEYLADLWRGAADLRATVPTAISSQPPYTLPEGNPLYLAINPPSDGALTFIHLSSDNVATLVYPNPDNATLGVLANEPVTVGDELNMAASEPLGREWIVLILTPDPLIPPVIAGSGMVEDWARYYEFGASGSPAEHLFLWLVDAVGQQPLAVSIVPVEIVRAQEVAL